MSRINRDRARARELQERQRLMRARAAHVAKVEAERLKQVRLRRATDDLRLRQVADMAAELRDMAELWRLERRPAHLAAMAALYRRLGQLGGVSSALGVTPVQLGIGKDWVAWLKERPLQPGTDKPAEPLAPVGPLPSLDEAIRELPRRTVVVTGGHGPVKHWHGRYPEHDFVTEMREQEFARREADER